MIPSSKRILSVGCLLAMLVLCLPLTLVARPELLNQVRRYVADGPPPVRESDQWTFSADRVVGDLTSEYVEAFGNCQLSLGENQLRADFARYYQNTGWVFVKGNIRAHWGGDFLEASEAEFDLRNMTGWLKNGKLFMAQPHLWVEAEELERKPGDTYTFRNAKVTACSGDRPAWSVTSEEGNATLDGRVRLYHTKFHIMDVPVMYSPFMALPGARKRQSGFLPPRVSNSRKLGFQLNMPYYWVISDEADMTLYQNYMSNRGYMQGVEFRHAEDVDTKGVWKADFLHDARRANTIDKEWKDYRDDGLLRPNRNRWWVRSKYDGWLGSPKWKVKLDLDLVSDQNYLRDFQDGPSGFDASRKEFVDTFGRDIANKDALDRISTAFMSRSWDKYGLAGKVEYDQNLRFFNGNGKASKNSTVQTLPEIDLFAFRQAMPGLPLEWDAEVKYDYFHRNYGNSGHRLDIRPGLSLPMSNKYVTFIPRAKAIQTFYSLSRQQNVNTHTFSRFNVEQDAAKDGFQSRTSWEGGFSLFSEVARVFPLGGDMPADPSLAGSTRWTRLKHSLTPRVEYTYSPYVRNQKRYPYFDSRDRLKGTNMVTYSLTNVLDRRRDRVVLAPGEKGAAPLTRVASDYLDFLTFRLEQSYDRNEATRKDMRDQYARRPFSDVLAEVVVKPLDYIDLTSRTWVSPYNGNVTQNENDIRLYKAGLGEFIVGYDLLSRIDEYKRYSEDDMFIFRAELNWQAASDFEVGLIYRRDFETDRDLEKKIRFAWNGECYGLYFSYAIKPSDDRFEFGFELANF
ncbi:LPS-assembly protein LptD [Pseudodesulfovibrio tunisiensis]|uniref:LPS-assembly protein LptD n=1 Tax=Pseudodesulfovibrio tunisiensis TaxID=463192 RepID=UPI001FB4607B|nr:LPS assembly protein LptD [Pseudodesulfovibrio tunisiensis]